MLYNFPKEEILKFYSKIFGDTEAAGQGKQAQGNFCSELYESIANFNYKYDPNHLDDGDVSDTSHNVLEEGHSVNRSGEMGVHSATNPRLPNPDIPAGIRSNDSLNPRRRRKKSMVEKLLRHKVMPTNVSNQISIWCDSIYDEYGQGDKLYFNEFVKWASIHKNFIFTFARYFRYTMWKTEKNPLTNREFLGFHKMTPVLQEDFQIKFSNEKQFRSALGCLYIEFLFIWYERSRTVPNKIKILRDVGITFDDQNMELQIAHFSSEYHNFTIRLSRRPVYQYWKEILTNYSRFFHQ